MISEALLDYDENAILVAKLAAGDPAFKAVLVDLLASKANLSADDIVQSALARAYVAWPRIRRGGTEDAYVRRSAAEALAGWGGADAIPALNKALADPDLDIVYPRVGSGGWINELGEGAAPATIEVTW